jgi:hypothetical protein
MASADLDRYSACKCLGDLAAEDDRDLVRSIGVKQAFAEHVQCGAVTEDEGVADSTCAKNNRCWQPACSRSLAPEEGDEVRQPLLATGSCGVSEWTRSCRRSGAAHRSVSNQPRAAPGLAGDRERQARRRARRTLDRRRQCAAREFIRGDIRGSTPSADWPLLQGSEPVGHAFDCVAELLRMNAVGVSDDARWSLPGALDWLPASRREAITSRR